MKTILYLTTILLVTACSSHKAIKPTASCLKYQQELKELKEKRRNHTLQNVTAFVLGGNLAHQEERRIDEKIHLLEMKLSECQK